MMILKARKKSYSSGSTGPRDALVTKSVLYAVRDELTEQIGQAKSELKSDVYSLRSEMNNLSSEVHGLESEVHSLKSEVHGLKSLIHKLCGLNEEQHAENRAVMDGLINLYARQDRVEARMDEFEKWFESFKR